MRGRHQFRPGVEGLEAVSLLSGPAAYALGAPPVTAVAASTPVQLAGTAVGVALWHPDFGAPVQAPVVLYSSSVLVYAVADFPGIGPAQVYGVLSGVTQTSTGLTALTGTLYVA